MTVASQQKPVGTVLIIGASRGLGLGMAAEFLKRGWNVVGTVRGDRRTELHSLSDAHPGRLKIESLDVTRSDEIAALQKRLSAGSINLLFVNAGTSNDKHEPIGEVPTDEFVRVMVTNALGPMRVVEGLQNLVTKDGMIGVMSSGLGSVTNNLQGGYELYRGSKAALNTYMRSYAARQPQPRSLVLMAPGWIRTDMGGPDAPFSIEESIPKVVDVLLAQQGKPGLHYVDRNGQTVAW